MLFPKGLSLVSLLLIAWKGAAETEEDRFSAAAGQLISSYVQVSLISEPVAAAASAASVTGDVASIITSALEATLVPAWFYGAIPTQYKTNIDAVIADIALLRAAATAVATETGSGNGQNTVTGGSSATTSPATTAGPPTILQTTVVSTGTDSAGKPFTTSIVSGITAPISSTSASETHSSTASSHSSGSTTVSSSTTGATSATSPNAAPAATIMSGQIVIAGVAAVLGIAANL